MSNFSGDQARQMERSQPMADDDSEDVTLLSDEPTVVLIKRARGGDESAVEAILQRCLPR